jgi:hypothetical protein
MNSCNTGLYRPHVYFEEEQGLQSTAKLLTKGEQAE